MLEKISCPDDLKGLKKEDYELLAAELRDKVLKTVASCGGHLSSNLGIVEATLALHTVFNAPADRIIFDVSHQCYAHKILTGRYAQFSTLRRAGGISGFSNPKESIYDTFYEGHCGTSISEALALATSDKLAGREDFTVAVVGDGAFTNGMIYEALNNCADKKLNLVILLNDNEMSISRNIGGLNNGLRRMRSGAGYFRFKHGLVKAFKRIPLIGKSLIKAGRAVKDFIKNLVLNKNIFENLGLDYIGPVDGNDFSRMCSVLAEAKTRHKCCVVHIYTKKGLGYPPAEAEPDKYHAVPPFDLERGLLPDGKDSFSSRFGDFVCAQAKNNGGIMAITAAMGSGTGLGGFAEKFPDRFFDVGIAEEHAVTFAAGLAAAGNLPIVAMYSTFSQRVYDQLFQDVCLGGLHVVLALDRCGFVEGDGLTHQGIYDYALFSTLPGVTIYSPATFAELDMCLGNAISGGGLQIVRYPKGGEGVMGPLLYSEDKTFAYTLGAENKKVVVLTYGRIAVNALPLADKGVGIVRLIKVFPFDVEKIAPHISRAETVLILEEGTFEGGLAQKITPYLMSLGKSVRVLAVTSPVLHGNLEDIYKSHGMSAEQIENFLNL